MSLVEYCILNGISLEIYKEEYGPACYYRIDMKRFQYVYTHYISINEVMTFAGNFSTIETAIIKDWEEKLHKYEKSLSDRVQELNLSGNSMGMCMGEHGDTCGKEASEEHGTD